MRQDDLREPVVGGEQIDDLGRNDIAGEALKWFLHPIRTLWTVLLTRSRGKERTLEEKVDQTVIGQGGSIDTVVRQLAHFGDCGHYLHGNLGGRCGCGAIVCRECLRRCARCGEPLCPPCSAVDPETGLVVCHICGDEISYQRRARSIGWSIGSLFLGTGDKGKEQ